MAWEVVFVIMVWMLKTYVQEKKGIKEMKRNRQSQKASVKTKKDQKEVRNSFQAKRAKRKKENCGLTITPTLDIKSMLSCKQGELYTIRY